MQNDSSSAIANKCLQLFKNGELADDGNSEVLRARVKAVKGLVELVQNNLDAGVLPLVLSLSILFYREVLLS